MELWDPSIYSEVDQEIRYAEYLISLCDALPPASTSQEAAEHVETVAATDPFMAFFDNQLEDITSSLYQSSIYDSPEQLFGSLNIACDESYSMPYEQNRVQDTSSAPPSTTTSFFKGSVATSMHQITKRRSPSPQSTSAPKHAKTNSSKQTSTYITPAHAFKFDKDAAARSFNEIGFVTQPQFSGFTTGSSSYQERVIGKDSFRLRTGGASVLGMGFDMATDERAWKRCRVDAR
jgi:hypothetical protein